MGAEMQKGRYSLQYQMLFYFLLKKLKGKMLAFVDSECWLYRCLLCYLLYFPVVF